MGRTPAKAGFLCLDNYRCRPFGSAWVNERFPPYVAVTPDVPFRRLCVAQLGAGYAMGRVCSSKFHAAYVSNSLDWPVWRVHAEARQWRRLSALGRPSRHWHRLRVGPSASAPPLQRLQQGLALVLNAEPSHRVLAEQGAGAEDQFLRSLPPSPGACHTHVGRGIQTSSLT